MLSTLFRPFRVPQQKSWRKRTGNKKFQLVWDESWMTKYTNTNTQIHKYTNTVWVKLGDRPIMCYIFEKDIVWGPQKQCSQVSDIKIYKYKYTNTQIQFGPKSSTTTSSSSSNYKSKFPNFAQNNFCFFLFDIHNNMFPNIVKKVFLKKIEKCKCYKPSSSDHQQQHHHHQTTKANSRTLLKTTSGFLIWYSQ